MVSREVQLGQSGENFNAIMVSREVQLGQSNTSSGVYQDILCMNRVLHHLGIILNRIVVLPALMASESFFETF
jgi:hypothetical protein